MSRRIRRAGRGALLTVAAFLVGSAILRIGLSVDAALAAGGLPDAGATAQAELPTTDQALPSEDLRAVMAELDARAAMLDEREAALVARMEALALAEEKIDAKTTRLIEAEQRLAATLARADTAAEADLSRLTAVYELMKHKEAAALFEQMDPVFAAGFLARMKPEAAAGVMAGLDPDTAYTVSVVLAGRNANAPRE